MGAGLKAWWLTLISGSVLSTIAVLGARWVGGLSRRTEIDKMYMEELKNVRAQLATKEKECRDLDAIIDAKETIIDELRKQHLIDLPCSEREKQLQIRIVELIESERQLKVQLNDFMMKFIGAKEPPERKG